jgi:hypothetical protein
MEELDEILEAILGSSAFDVVGVYDQNYNQVFSSARPMKAAVLPNKKIFTQPAETGIVLSDGAILEPVRLTLSLIFLPQNYRDTYEEVMQLYKASTLLIVQTRASVYTNQVIESVPHDEDTDIVNTLAMSMKLTEVQFATSVTEAIQPREKKNSNTVDRGTQQSKPANQSANAEIVDKISAGFGGS